MQIHILTPILCPIILAFIVYGIGRKNKKYRDYAAVAVTAYIFILLLCQLISFLAGKTESFGVSIPNICGLGLSFKMDGFRALYTTIASFMWLVCTCFSVEYNEHHRNRNRFYMFMLITLGATLGVFLSADLGTTFLFFEIASLASFTWVIQEETEGAIKAAYTYLAVAVIGGLIMLMGLFMLYDITGTLAIDELRSACAPHLKEGQMVAAGMCIFWGFAAKAGAFPIHIWLPKAHPVAPAPASALLSGMLTKVGVFGILVVSLQMFSESSFWGSFLLIVAVCTFLLGAVLALFSVDMKRILACSSVSQIGFILTGVAVAVLLGEENGLAVRGALLYMVNHSLFKLVLFLVAGVVFMNLHALDLNVIKGFGRKKPWLMAVYLCAALGISGVPMFSGYVSKTLIHEGMVEYIELVAEGIVTEGFGVVPLKIVEWLFLISGGMTFAYMTKLFFALFVEKNADAALQKQYDAKTNYIRPINRCLLSIGAVLFLVFGILPNLVFDKLADVGQGFFGLEEFEETVHYFSIGNLKGSLTSLAIGALIYHFFVRKVLKTKSGEYLNKWPEWLDLEYLVYRRVLFNLADVFACLFKDLERVVDGFVAVLKLTVFKDSPIPTELAEGNELTHFVGSRLDRRAIRKGLQGKSDPNTYEHRLALAWERFSANSLIVTRSLSFGLIFFCIGLAFVLIYMLWR